MTNIQVQVGNNEQREIIVRKEVDGMKFYVSIDGKQSGMSVRGLARMAGVALSTVQKLLLKVDNPTDKDVPENLQPFIGKVFELSNVTASNEGAGKKTPEMLKVLSSKDLYLQVDADKNAQVIPADICAVIV